MVFQLLATPRDNFLLAQLDEKRQLWYRKPGRHAVLKAIIRPAPLAVDEIVEVLHHCLAEVNAEISILLHQRVHGVEARNEKLLFEIGELKAQLTIMKETADQGSLRKDGENLEYLRQILGKDLQEYQDPELCRKHLEDAFLEALGAFGVRQDWSANYHQMTSKLLISDAAYRNWRLCASSCVLVIAGSTALQGRAPQSQSGCWLPPAALHVFDILQPEDTTKVIFYTRQPDFKESVTSLRQVVSSLVCQVLAWGPEIVRHTFKELRLTVESDAWSSKDSDVAIACQIGPPTRVISLLPVDKKVTLILDRLDLCREHTHRILQALQSLFEHQPNGVKILIAMREYPTTTSEAKCEISQNMAPNFPLMLESTGTSGIQLIQKNSKKQS
ncbi:MAG: hypothetical protein Q9170_006224 [Blastenia crenularia]